MGFGHRSRIVHFSQQVNHHFRQWSDFGVGQSVARHQKLVEEFKDGPKSGCVHWIKVLGGQALIVVVVIQAKVHKVTNDVTLPFFVIERPTVLLAMTSVNGTPFSTIHGASHD